MQAAASHVKVNKEDIDSCIAEADANNDGRISRDEALLLVAAWRSIANDPERERISDAERASNLRESATPLTTGITMRTSRPTPSPSKEAGDKYAIEKPQAQQEGTTGSGAEKKKEKGKSTACVIL